MNLTLIQWGVLMAMLGGIALFGGGVMIFIFRSISSRVLSALLGFTAGILLYVAFANYLPSAKSILNEVHTDNRASVITTTAFFIGTLATLPIDLLLAITRKKAYKTRMHSLWRTNQLTLLIFLSISFHNFVEGIATFLSIFSYSRIAIPVIISIIAHNIPEGIIIAMSIYKITGSKKKSLVYCAASGLGDILGAFFAYSFLPPFNSLAIEGMVRAFLAGLLVNTALDELIPGAELRSNHTFTIRFIIVGMLFMALILIFLH